MADDDTDEAAAEAAAAFWAASLSKNVIGAAGAGARGGAISSARVVTGGSLGTVVTGGSLGTLTVVVTIGIEVVLDVDESDDDLSTVETSGTELVIIAASAAF